MEITRLEYLLSVHFGESATPEEKGQLEQLLLDHQAARDAFWDAARWDLALQLAVRGEALAHDEPLDEPTEPMLASRWAGTWTGGWRAARHWISNPTALSVIVSGLFLTIVLLSLALLTVPVWRPAVDPGIAERPRFVARLERTRDAEWGKGTEVEPGRVTDLFAGQPLELLSGLAEIRFDDGARLLVEGPARLVVESSGRISLHDGKLTANVPAAAIGFAVDTEFAEIIDLGTEFGVAVEEDQTEVQVFEGAVRFAAHGGSSQKSIRLRAGEAARASSTGRIEQVPDADIRRFVRSLDHERRATTTVATFSGLDGLDLAGEFPYAINFGGAATEVSGIHFTAPEETTGLAHEPGHTQAAFFPSASFGDDGLNAVMQSIHYERHRPLTMTLEVEKGAAYRLQLLICEPQELDRRFGIEVNGRPVVEVLRPWYLAQSAPPVAGRTMGVVCRHGFTAKNGQLVIRLLPGESTPEIDGNPYLQALTLERLPPEMEQEEAARTKKDT